VDEGAELFIISNAVKVPKKRRLPMKASNPMEYTRFKRLPAS